MASEVLDLGFDITWSDSNRTSNATNVVADLYGIGIEFQSTRDQR